MLLPFRTNAPVYHWPLATGGLILANILAFVAVQEADPETIADLVLVHGDGLHPLQWITSNFVHGGLFHLLGNLVFLWVFGLVVEGKVGWLFFLPIYFGVGLAECGLEQVVFLGSGGGSVSYGASAIIFGLVGMAMVWAPQNDVEVFYWIVRPGTFTVTIEGLALIYLALEVLRALFASLGGELLSSAALHLTGGVLGFFLGAAFVRWKLVDCEGWDLFSRRRKALHRKSAKQPAPEEHAPVAEPAKAKAGRLAEERQTTLELIRGYLQEGDAAMAASLYREALERLGGLEPAPADLPGLFKALRKARAWKELGVLLRQVIAENPRRSAPFNLLLAEVLIEGERRPASALDLLESIPAGSLKEAQETSREALIGKPRRLQEEGVLELDVE